MIHNEATLKYAGYDPRELKPQSNKRVCKVCDICGRVVWCRMCDYSDLCHSCACQTDEHRKNVSKTMKGVAKTVEHRKAIGDGNRGKIISDDTRARTSKAMKGKKRAPFTDEARANMSKAQKGKKNPPLTKEHKRKLAEARRGQKHTDEAKQKMSEARKGEKHWGFGKHLSDEVKQKISDANTGKIISDEARRKMSATRQGIPYEEWKGFIIPGEYCEKFDDACRDRIRAKYNNRCFMCDKLQDENITKSGKQILLAVHHYDMNKDAGCNGNLWKLVPLCLHCHAISHTPTWTARIEYLLRCVWNSD